jgi:hypothetical protein
LKRKRKKTKTKTMLALYAEGKDLKHRGKHKDHERRIQC